MILPLFHYLPGSVAETMFCLMTFCIFGKLLLAAEDYITSFRSPFSAFPRLIQLLSKDTLETFSRGIKGSKTAIKYTKNRIHFQYPYKLRRKLQNAEIFDLVLQGVMGNIHNFEHVTHA